MSLFKNFIDLLQMEMNTPNPYGWFHLLWVLLSIILIIILFFKKKKSNKQLKMVLSIYAIPALILELLKQISWATTFDISTNSFIFDYEWYAAPFQLCTTPIYVCILCLFLKEGKIRESLLSYMAYITILGSFMTMLIPSSCFVTDILVNIHTMWLHCGSFVVSIYLLMSGFVKVNKTYLKNAFIVFLVFVFIAESLNIIIYNSGVLNDESFNMFYISPYFISSLPVFDIIQENVPFLLFMFIYLLVIFIGSLIVYYISFGIKKLIKCIK